MKRVLLIFVCCLFASLIGVITICAIGNLLANPLYLYRSSLFDVYHQVSSLDEGLLVQLYLSVIVTFSASIAVLFKKNRNKR